jgi:hypothetical protein
MRVERPMISDSLHYALISESLEGSFPERRRAASIMLEVARAEATDDLRQVLAAVEERFGDGVAPEARALVEEIGLN